MASARLLADIDSCQVNSGELALWWLGQHSFIAKFGRTIVYLDPFLTPLKGRAVPPLLAPNEIAHADLIFGTHDHADHIDRPVWPALAKASPRARFVVPALLKKRLANELGIPDERFIGLDDGQSVTAGGLKISAVAAAHEFLDQDPRTGQYPYLGYILEGNGCTLYHAGDCCIYEGLQTKLRQWKIGVALLPINGRDAVRYASGCIGNMTYQEAADLAGAIEAGLAIPAHYDMFAANSADPRAFTEYMRVKYPARKTHVCEYATRLVWKAR